MASRNLAELLRCLVRGNVECILVGGELKRNAGRPKDLAVLPVLEATLELTRK